MKKEDYIETTLNSVGGIKGATPPRDLFRSIYNNMQQNKTLVVSFVSMPKIAAVAAAFTGLLLINIWLLSASKLKSTNKKEIQQLIEQYSLVNDDIISFQ